MTTWTFPESCRPFCPYCGKRINKQTPLADVTAYNLIDTCPDCNPLLHLNARDRILNYMKAHKIVTEVDIANGLGYTQDEVNHLLFTLKKEGIIRYVFELKKD